MVDGMKKMLGWHRDAFSVFPVGQGHDVDVHEFDFRDNGGVIYDKDGVKVIHWQRSHAKDGASAYRLDWNGMCVVWTGDGRPSHLDKKYAEGCDLYITELQPEVVEINSGVQACRACRLFSPGTRSIRIIRPAMRPATSPTRSSRDCS